MKYHSCWTRNKVIDDSQKGNEKGNIYTTGAKCSKWLNGKRKLCRHKLERLKKYKTLQGNCRN